MAKVVMSSGRVGSSGSIVRTLGPCRTFSCSGTLNRSSDANQWAKTDLDIGRSLPSGQHRQTSRDYGSDPSPAGDGDRRVCSSRTGRQAPSWLVFRCLPAGTFSRDWPRVPCRPSTVSKSYGLPFGSLSGPFAVQKKATSASATGVPVSSTTHPLMFRISPACTSPAMTNPSIAARITSLMVPISTPRSIDQFFQVHSTFVLSFRTSPVDYLRISGGPPTQPSYAFGMPSSRSTLRCNGVRSVVKLTGG